MLKCLFGHKWQTVLVGMGYKKPSRRERKCERCSKRQIEWNQFSPRVQQEIRKRRFTLIKGDLGLFWLDYYKNSYVDLYTRYVLTKGLEE